MSQLFIGLMSGTSMDGVDAVLLSFSDRTPQLIAHHFEEMPAVLRQQLLALCEPGYDEINRLGQLDRQVADLFVAAVLRLLEQAKVKPNDICAIGSHGQTIRHQPQLAIPFTLQIGDPNTIAERTGITTVADFRRRDMVLGGQGAPLTPLFHEWLFGCETESRVVLNIGGMSNVTLLSNNPKQTNYGFDTGPGNVLLNAWTERHLSKLYDHNGEWAAVGKCNEVLLQRLLNDPFFQQAPPKSTGRECFNLSWLEQHITKLNQMINPEDVQATLLELTTRSIADVITTYGAQAKTVLVCGGGVHNGQLMTRLQKLLGHHQVASTQQLGIDPDWLEAMAFAWFAKQTLAKQALDCTPYTGASQATILGGIYH